MESHLLCFKDQKYLSHNGSIAQFTNVPVSDKHKWYSIECINWLLMASIYRRIKWNQAQRLLWNTAQSGGFNPLSLVGLMILSQLSTDTVNINIYCFFMQSESDPMSIFFSQKEGVLHDVKVRRRGYSSEGKISTIVRYLFHGESDIPTLDNPFANPGINVTRPFCYLRGDCSFRLIFLYWRAFPVGSTHISVRFMFVKPPDVPPLLCFNMQTEMKLCAEQLLFTTPTIWKHELVLFLHVKAKQRRIHVLWFHKHKTEPKYV